jgi:hypothetical protein
MKYLIALILLSGCASVSVIPLGEQAVRKPSSTVLVFASPESVGRKYKEIAQLSFVGGEKHDKAVKKLIEKAQEMGADAIILGETKMTRHWNGVASVSKHAMSCVAVVYE